MLAKKEDFSIFLVTFGLPLIKYVLTPLAESILILIGLPAAAATTDAAIQKNIFVSGTAVLKLSNEEMENILNRSRNHDY